MNAAPFDPMLSVFRCATDPRVLINQKLSDVAARIRSLELAHVTADIARTYAEVGGGKAGKDAIAELKRALPCVTLAGVFDRRANAGWKKPSGLIQIDLDNLGAEMLATVRAKLLTFPWVAVLWTSPSGDGLKAGVRVPRMLLPDPQSYLIAWSAVTRWLASLELENDPSAKDIARLAFLAHDPEAWYNSEATPFDLDSWAEPDQKRQISTHVVPPMHDSAAIGIVERARRYLVTLPPSIAHQHGHDALFRAAVSVAWGFDLPDAEAVPLLEEYNRNAVPPWDTPDLIRKLDQARTVQHREPRGWLLASPGRTESSVPAWPSLFPIGRETDPPPFNMLEMLPVDVPELGHLVDAVSEAIQVPLELVACAAVGLAALACARAVEVQCSLDWREPAPLWMLPLLRPGERKSSCLGMLMRPFPEWAAEEREKLAEPLARYVESRHTMEARLMAVRGKAAKEVEPDKRKKWEQEASDLAAGLEAMPARLAAPDLLVQSFTPEGLRDALEANGEKMGIVSAEADAAELLGARYSDAGPSLDLLLCAHSGDPITTRRAGGRCVPLERPAVGMVLAVQPEAVRAVLADRAARGRGLIDRMLLVHPPSRLGTRMLDPPPIPSAVSSWWTGIIGAQLDLPWPGRIIVGQEGTPVRCSSLTRILSLSVEARSILWALRDKLEPRMAEGADLAAVSGFTSKLSGACARIALAFTMLRNPEAEVVGEEAMRAACAWAPFLLAHHQAVLGEAAERPEAHHARRLWNALKRRGRATMSGRDLFRMVHDSALPDMDTFAPVLALMLDHGAVRLAARNSNRPGRPPELYEVHPDLLPEADLSDMSNISQGGIGAA